MTQQFIVSANVIEKAPIMYATDFLLDLFEYKYDKNIVIAKIIEDTILAMAVANFLVSNRRRMNQ